MARAASPRRGLAAGLGFALAEAAQSIALLPLIRERVGAEAAAAWVVLGASSALAGLAGTAYFQPLVRSIVALQGAGTARLPANWPALQRRLAGRCALLLAGLQLLFVLCLPGREAVLERLGLPVLLALFAAQQLRLLALGQFTAFNGLAWLGEDKLQMARASLAGLLGSLLVLGLGGGLGGLASVQLLAQGGLAWGARRSLRGLGRDAAAAVALLAPGPAAALFCLGLAGYLNMGTDTLVAASALPPAQVVDYGVLSRSLALLPAALALWVHVHYPAWCAPGQRVAALRRDLGRVLLGLSLGLPLLALGFLAWPGRAGLPAGLVLPAVLNSGLASAVMVLGQMLLARDSHGFVGPAAALAALAPALAWLAARQAWPGSFVSGYLLCNALLLAWHLGWFWRLGREPVPRACEEAR